MMKKQIIQINKNNEQTIISNMKKDGWVLESKEVIGDGTNYSATFVKTPDSRISLNG